MTRSWLYSTSNNSTNP